MVVTGGAGFIGSHIADALVAEGHDVHIIDSMVAGKREHVPEGASLHEVDILDTAAILPIIEGAHTVFHLAALPRVQFSIDHPVEAHQANVNGTLSVLIAARDGKARRVVYSASSSAYGEQKILPLHEDMPAKPVHPYGLQKYMSELYMTLFSEVFGVPTVSLRYFNIYGPRLDPNGAYALVIGKFLQLRTEGKALTITGDGSQTRDFTHVFDAVRANLLASESEHVGKGEVVNIGVGKNTSMNELADLIGGEREYIPARIEAMHTQADNRRAKELLGWEPTITLEEGVAELKREWGLD